jgi:hypothetical protein
MAKTQGAPNMTVKFTPNDKGNPPGKLADAELHFAGGPLDGLKLLGFAVWERRTGGRTVTFPARQYSVNGERRSFALLRPVAHTASQERLRDIILAAYAEHEAALAESARAVRRGASLGAGRPDFSVTPFLCGRRAPANRADPSCVGAA